ncbi:MAG TPA: wax ester/triacylglycerol synthase family O-acyltransferase [Usitatibacteraceae bacterium]|nr:wax ester/triacylglycerol synthase family O-acyltransferase [Burkholderiales bacterium]HQY45691.1 wax ester/triacylglycerol synthase family O-acyltransferase [Usitatibacteraceae bacterium]HRA23697.1 wax ester/triacylglycerol synthase family O-acyltransferase [Usitatibacteraceae bacterium]
MAEARRERISGVDTAWLRMDMPTNLMVIVGVLMFEGRLEPARVKRTLERRFLAYRRFRQKAVQDPTGAWWEDDADFDIDSHVHQVALPGKAGKAELQAYVSDLASTPLDATKPLWQFHLVDNFDGGSALVMRIHHCYADGIALVQVMLSMTEKSARASLALPAQRFDAGDSGDAAFWEQVLKPVAGALEGATRVGRNLLDQGRELAANPGAAQEVLEGATRKGMDFAGELAKLALMGNDSPTRFKGRLGARKRVAWAEPLPLDEVKVMGKALGCSINDVLLAMATGALREYLSSRGDPVDGLGIRAIVPVNLRPEGQARELGNRFGLVFLDLPIGTEDPLQRLREVRAHMQALKGSFQPLIVLGLLHAVGYGPRILQEQITGLLSQNASAVMTNVPGPQHPVWFAGRRIEELNFWVPQSGGIGMGVSILSYDGRIQFGLIADAGLVPDPDRIVGRFTDEFDKLMWLTLMSPWEGEADAAPAPGKAPRKPRAARPAKAAGEPAAAVVPKRFRNL